METFIFDGEQDATEEQLVEQGGMDSSEEAFMKGYTEDDVIIECAECGGAVSDEKKIIQEFDGEKQIFCCEECVKEFKESIGTN